MGFAGSIFAKSQAEAELIKEKGVLNMLREIGAPMKWLAKFKKKRLNFLCYKCDFERREIFK